MDIETLVTTEQVITALGGNRPVARLTSAKHNAVSNWRKCKTFPARTYLALTAALHARGKSAPPSLWGMLIDDASHDHP